MKNITNPLQDTIALTFITLEAEKRYSANLTLAPNSFEDDTDYIGLLKQETNTTEFLTVHSNTFSQ